LDGQGGVYEPTDSKINVEDSPPFFKFDLHKSSPSGVAKNLHAIHRLQKLINSKDNG
jgi:hypothetical protein